MQEKLLVMWPFVFEGSHTLSLKFRATTSTMSRRILIFILLCALYNSSVTSNGHSNLLIEEVRRLSELPLERLIQIKSSFVDADVADEPIVDEGPARSTALTLPMALPFKRINTNKAIRRHEDYWDEKGKDTKISKIFQLAITALSFLAFGGYLLTLIIMAIRRNSVNPNNTGNVIVFSNLQNLQKFKRPKRHAWIMDSLEDDFDTDQMYRGMIMLSQGCAMYNQG